MLEMALVGYQHQREKIVAIIQELKRVSKGPASRLSAWKSGQRTTDSLRE